MTTFGLIGARLIVLETKEFNTTPRCFVGLQLTLTFSSLLLLLLCILHLNHLPSSFLLPITYVKLLYRAIAATLHSFTL